MEFTKDLNSAAGGFVIRIKAIRCNGYLDGYDVQITQATRSVKYIYRFPATRAEVLTVILRQIGMEIENFGNRGRREHKGDTISLPLRQLARPRLRRGAKHT